MADGIGGMTYDGDVSNDKLGNIKDSTRPDQQAQMRVASAAAANQRKIEGERLKMLNGAKEPGKTQAALRSSDLRSISRSQTQPRDPGGPQSRSNPQASQTQSRAAQAIASYNSRDAPATPSRATHVPRQELGNLRVPTKAQHQSQLNALSYSPEKQQKIANQWQQTKGRAREFVQNKNAERTNDMRSARQSQSRSSVSVQAQGTTSKKPPPAPRPKKRPKQQRAKAFTKEYQEDKKQNVFDKYSQQRDKSQAQQQQKGKGRGR